MVTFRYLGIKKVRAMTTATSRFTRSTSDGTDAERSARDGSGKFSNTSARKKRNHLLQLRNITAKLLKEESEIRTTSSFNGNAAKNPPNSHRSIPKITEDFNEEKVEDHSVIKAWVEPSKVGKAKQEWLELEASPIEIIAVKPQHPSDTATEKTALCSAFEMLSFENFCNAGLKCSTGPANPAAPPVNTEPYKVVGHLPAHDDGFAVPREISFANPGICGCSSIPIHKEHHLIGQHLSYKNKISHKNQKGMFMKRLLPGFKPAKPQKSDMRVMKVKVYVDAPKQNMGSGHSIGDSTLTMPKELRRSGTNTTI